MEKMCQLRWGEPAAAPGVAGLWSGTAEAVGHVPLAPIDAAVIARAAGPLSDAEVVRRMVRETGGLPNVPPNPAGQPPKTAADEAEFLLQVASEVEHGLLVQYLYAAYSTTDDGTVPANA